MRPSPRFGWVAALPASLFILAFAVLPLSVLVRNALGVGDTGLHEQQGFTLGYLAKVFTTPALLTSTWHSVLVCVVAVGVAIAISIPLVLELAARSRRGGSTEAADTVITMPIALPGTVIGFFFIVLLGNTGLFGQVVPSMKGLAYLLPGVLLAYVYFSLPRIIGPLRGAAQALDPALTDTARSLGASRARVFRTVTWPLLLPAVLESAGTALATALGGYGTIATLSQGVRLLPLDVVDELSSAGYNVAQASATAIVLGALSILFLVAGQVGASLVRRARASAPRSAAPTSAKLGAARTTPAAALAAARVAEGIA